MTLPLATTLNNFSITLIIWGICAGVILGFIYNYISRAVAGPFVRALLEKGCIGQSNAISLRDAGFSDKRILYFLLSDGSSLRNIISVVGGKLPTVSQGKRTLKDYESASFYISEASKDKADAAFGRTDKWYYLVIFTALAAACAYGMTKIMPLLMEWLF